MMSIPNFTSVKRTSDWPGTGNGGNLSSRPESQNEMELEIDSLGPKPPKSQKIVDEFIAEPNQEERIMQVLQLQHKRLRQRLEFRQRKEQELFGKINQLETRQTEDDGVLNVIHSYWNQLNEDIRILLQRFETETSDGSEVINEREIASFLIQFSACNKEEELDCTLAESGQVPTREAIKIILAFDNLQQRNESISRALSGELGCQPLEDLVGLSMLRLQTENHKLQALTTNLHQRSHVCSLKMVEYANKLSEEETQIDELKDHLDDLTWEITKLAIDNDKLISSTLKVREEGKNIQHHHHQLYGAQEKSKYINPRIKDNDLRMEIEELKKLANNRLIELESVHQSQRETLKELEELRMALRQLPESVIVETTEYKCLQAKFSVIYNDSVLLRQSFEEAKQNYFTMKDFHLKKIAELENEDLMGQKKLNAELIQLQDLLAQVRKENETLSMDQEQNLARNNQMGPVNREMRHLITSLQNHNQLLKTDSIRYRRQYKELIIEVMKLKKLKEQLELRLNLSENCSIIEEDSSSSSSHFNFIQESCSPNSNNNQPQRQDSSNNDQCNVTPKGVKSDQAGNNAKEPKTAVRDNKKIESEKRLGDAELTKELKKMQNEQKEMKLLLDMYKGSSKDRRDRVQLMAAEKKARLEIEDLRQQVKKLHEITREESKKSADEVALKKIKLLEDQVHTLQKQVTAQKLEGETLLNDMEVTGQAYEDMQEQNSRLIQQLSEKDDTNFKLISDRIRSTQLHKLALEERELLLDQITSLTSQLEAQNQLVRKLEEKEKVSQNSMMVMDQEGRLRLKASDMNKRKAIESTQSATELKLQLEKYHTQMKEALQAVAEKTSALGTEAYKTKRLEEEIEILKKKEEKLNRLEMASDADEVLLEEIREFKEILTCPSCKVKRKDAVLSKCFHVFCFDCLRTRYEARQRKCPKCNAGFGANDYHRLYLT